MWFLLLENFTKIKTIDAWDDDVEQPIMYTIKDFNGEPITGSFYEQELQRVSPKIADVRLVEDVLKECTVKGKKQLLVKWLGLPEKLNQWIPAEDVVADLRKKKGK